MMSLPDGEKKYVYSFRHNALNVIDRRTDRQTDTARRHSIARQKLLSAVVRYVDYLAILTLCIIVV